MVIYIENTEAINSVNIKSPKCKYCGSLDIVKHGFRKNRQYYLCKNCKKSYAPKETGKIRKLSYIKPTKELLEKLYWLENKSCIVIGKELGIPQRSVIHYMKGYGIKRRTLSEARMPRVGSASPSWKGGRVYSKGYIMIYSPDHNKIGNRHYVFEHIAIWEKVNNQKLPVGWIVHHLNGVKDDNRPDNLVAMPSKEHLQLLGVKAKRIRELEVKVKLLEQTLENTQGIIKIGEN